MKKFLTATLAAITTTCAVAQSSITRCNTHEVMLHKEQQNPGYLNRVDAAFNYAKQVAETNRQNRAANDTIYHIRCVFHVVYTNATENIPDSVIQSQIEVLNEDYRRLNADTTKTRDVFKPIAADAGIEFYLATEDPDGNPTTGITHDVGTPGFLGFTPFDDGVKSAATGGVDPWPTDKYLNIWVCNIFNGIGILGYAFPPDNAPNWDPGSGTDSAKQGVVLHYPVVGRNYVAPIDPTVAKGRSATHEIGHYLGLRHIWGDGDCTMDDGISDTPGSDAAHQQTCDTSSNTCVDSPIDVPDMIENYMDYSDDRCLNMFTQEQVAIMRATLQTERAGIATTEVATGIRNTTEVAGVNVYPNPAHNVLNLNVSNARQYSYTLYNALGEILTAENNLLSYHTVNLTSFASGIYFVKITCGNQVSVRKFQIVK